jgi:hypothetical protein
VLFPDQLDDWTGEDYLFRVLGIFDEKLDLPFLGFTCPTPRANVAARR